MARRLLSHTRIALALGIVCQPLSPLLENGSVAFALDSAASGSRLVPPFTDTLATLSAGGASTCVTTVAGAAWCWGNFGPRDASATRVIGRDAQPVRLRSLATSDLVRCGITFDRDVWCDRGVTGGFVDSAGRREPVPRGCRYGGCLFPLPIRGALHDVPIRAVVAGFMHACALTPTGAAYCWGRNWLGTLGNGTWAADSTGSGGQVVRAPTAVVGSIRFSQLSATSEVTCGLSAPEGDVYCWGYGQSGETGDSSVMTYCSGKSPFVNTPCSTPRPARVVPEILPGEYLRLAGVKFTSVSAGFRMACAVSDNAEAYCWGSNYRCELGRCGSAESARAHRIPVPGRVAEVAAGQWHACARTEDRRIFCWGNNTSGQLGSLATVNATYDGGPPDHRDATNRGIAAFPYRDPCFNGGRCSPVSVEVVSPHRWVALALGTDHACALAEDDGGIYCWGGTQRMALGLAANLVTCENRSAVWEDTRCQPTPVRVPGLPPLAPPRPVTDLAALGSGRLPGNRSVPDAAETRVTVSRRELRVAFRPDSAGLWGWSDRADVPYRPEYEWIVQVEGMDGPSVLSLRVGRDGTQARDFTSLDSLLASGRTLQCHLGLAGSPCREGSLSASVDDQRVVLTLRDSAAIGRLFGLRPPIVTVQLERPDQPFPYLGDSVRVEYIAPQIPVPTDSTRADAARSRRAYLASGKRITREIAGGFRRDSTLWLALGDSARVYVAEGRCDRDFCFPTEFPLRLSWTIGDTSVIRARAVDRGVPLQRLSAARVIVLTGRRPGRTSLRAELPESPSDTMPSSTPPPRSLSSEIIVTNPVARVELTSPADTVHTGEAVQLRARAFDTSGGLIGGAPVTVRLTPDALPTTADVSGHVSVTFRSAGLATVIATFADKADTLAITVTNRRTP